MIDVKNTIYNWIIEVGIGTEKMAESTEILFFIQHNTPIYLGIQRLDEFVVAIIFPDK